jgi:hypothetical protein
LCEHPFVWSRETYGQVLRLFGTGVSDYEIARRTGVPRSTVLKWRRHGGPTRTRPEDAALWTPPDGWAYSYVLGLYLGDGHIVVRRERPRFLRLCLDAAYPELIEEAAMALERTFAPSRAHRYSWGEARREVVQICNVVLLVAFPQHGPGRKHDRRIELKPWQLELTRAHPGALVRGLIHSDGCRTINRFTTKLPSGRTKEYAYPRYFFTNESADIRAIFCEHCDLLGVRWSRSNRKNISISNKNSVAILDEVVGPKT